MRFTCFRIKDGLLLDIWLLEGATCVWTLVVDLVNVVVDKLCLYVYAHHIHRWICMNEFMYT